MVGQSTSIQAFFPPQSSPIKPSLSAPSSPISGDGFTSEELQNALQPTPHDDWTPGGEYDEYEIDSLVPGPARIKIVGRLVNLFENSSGTKLPLAAKGALHIVVKDDTGAVTIRLSYSESRYQLRIGQLVVVWATYVANGDRGMFPCAAAPLFIKIFPEKEKSCHIRVLADVESMSLCRKPLNYEAGLMSLQNFMQGGFEVVDAKVLVIVKSVSPRKKISRKDGTTADLVRVGVMDDTGEATLSLWGINTTTPTDWQASRTALLISSPGLQTSHTSWLSLTSDTFIDVDPDIPEATRLRKFAERLIRKGHVNPAFPHDEFNHWSGDRLNEHILYSLAELDDRAREVSEDKFDGYLSMLIMDLNISTLRQQNMLMCNECCGIPVYANLTFTTCKQCGTRVPLGINPRLIGKLVDETGCVTSGKLLLSDHAWTRLLGRNADELVKSSASVLKSVEQRMLYVRITLRFWWNGEVGRLVVSDIFE